MEFLAGCVGGSAGVLVGHPFDTVKVRLQADTASNPRYRGTLHCFSSIIKHETAFGLFKGMSSPLYGLSLINAILFGVHGNMRLMMREPNSVYANFLCGACAGFLQSFVCGPMELAKTRMQVRYPDSPITSEYRGTLHCLSAIYRSGGRSALFRGFWLTVVRETPSFGVYFAVYEWLCERSVSREHPHPSTDVILMAGGVAGVISWISTYPADVIKTRVQADITNRYSKWGGAWQCAKEAYHSEGAMVFWRGLASTLLRAFPVNAITFATFALIMRLVDGNHVIFDEERNELLDAKLLEEESHRHHTHFHHFPVHV